MTNIISVKDKTAKTLREFMQSYQNCKSNGIPEDLTIVWNDLFGKRIYFKTKENKICWIFKKYTLDTILWKLRQYGISRVTIDIQHMLPNMEQFYKGVKKI